MTVRFCLILQFCLLSSACGGPLLMLPGGELRGTVVEQPVNDWSFVDATFLHLETNNGTPRSVELNYVVRDGKLYIDPAEGRTWFDHLRANLDVRIRLGDRIYPVRATLVGKPGELEGFDSDRYIYQLESRGS